MKLTEAELKAISNETWADCRTPVAKFLKADRQRQQLLSHIRTPDVVTIGGEPVEIPVDDSAAQDGATPGEDADNEQTA